MKKTKRLICCSILMLALCLAGCGEKSGGVSSEAPASASSETASFGTTVVETGGPEAALEAEESAEAEPEPEPGIAFPYELDGGKLLVTSLFQSSLMNPDCGLQEGENIATLEIINQSDECLTLGSFEATMADGRVLRFSATDIPAGAKVWAFETSNQSMDDGERCISLTAEPQYEAEDQRIPDGISVDVDGISVTLTNQTGAPVTNLKVYYHDCFEDAYFGGLVYTYSIEEIPEGGIETFEANDSIFGNVEVVRITLENES